MAQALVRLDAGSGASMFTMDSCLHSLHLIGRLWTVVSGLILRILPFPQIGQITHPSFTISLPAFRNLRNPFLRFVHEKPPNYK